VRSTHLFEDIDEPMLADHSSLVVTQRYIDRDREAWRTNVDLVCPNGWADYFLLNILPLRY